jgi:SAM-dependent methyltransferase
MTEPKMTRIPDLNDARYLDEVGWFLYHEKYGREKFGGTYDAERLAYSQLLLQEVLSYIHRDLKWLENKTVVSIGCGCTGDLTSFPAAMKLGIDPLLYVYDKLGLLMPDATRNQTMYLSIGAENLPLLDDFADLVLCRNALDHMPKPELALGEIRRILKPEGFFFASVDIGGVPTPDEPTVFSVESLRVLLSGQFDVLTFVDVYPPHSEGRVCSTRIAARKNSLASQQLDKQTILRRYESQLDASKPAGSGDGIR